MPSNKVGAAALASALGVLLVWAIEQFAGVEIPSAVQLAIVTLLTFGVGYVVPEGNPSPSGMAAAHRKGHA